MHKQSLAQERTYPWFAESPMSKNQREILFFNYAIVRSRVMSYNVFITHFLAPTKLLVKLQE